MLAGGHRWPSEIVQPIGQRKRMSQHLNETMLSKKYIQYLRAQNIY